MYSAVTTRWKTPKFCVGVRRERLCGGRAARCDDWPTHVYEHIIVPHPYQQRRADVDRQRPDDDTFSLPPVSRRLILDVDSDAGGTSSPLLRDGRGRRRSSHRARAVSRFTDGAGGVEAEVGYGELDQETEEERVEDEADEEGSVVP
jgi:hypothetical protein